MKRVLASSLACIVLGGCFNFPQYSEEQQHDLDLLEQRGHSPDECPDLPKSKLAATLLDILPLPGLGHYYVGDVSDGLKVTFFFWLAIPWIIGPIDAYEEAKYRNDVYYLTYAKDHGWLDEKQQTPPAGSSTNNAAEWSEKSSQKQAAFCPQCGHPVEANDTFCKGCGAKLAR